MIERLWRKFRPVMVFFLKPTPVYFIYKYVRRYKPNDYERWIKEFDKISLSDRKAIRMRLKTLNYHPLISVVMPVYNTNPKFLKLAIKSVRKQIYSNWELCIADDASTDPQVKTILNSYAKIDPRIKVIYREINGNVSEASNSALQLATGKFIALLDHDDELREHALYLVVEELNAYPNAALIYSDEDRIDKKGRRLNYYFKSDWNAELLYGQNYINHLAVYRRSIVEKIGGFRKGYEGSQDYDLVLRVIEVIEVSQIRHIPHILYHWRYDPKSVSNAKASSCEDIARKAIQSHLERQRMFGAQAVQNLFVSQFHRVVYPLQQAIPLVSIIIPTKDKLPILKCCIESILQKTEYSSFELIIIDNQSQELETKKYFEEISITPNIKVIPYNQPFNYSKINNYAVNHARGEILLFLNNDTEVISSSWLTEMVSHFIKPDVGIVGSKLYYPDGSIQHAGVIGGMGGVAGHIFSGFPNQSVGYAGKICLTQNFLAVTAACMAIRRSIFEGLGGFEENTLVVAFNDVDLCLRAYKKGYKIVWTPFAELYHHESLSRGLPKTSEEKQQETREINYMLQHWGDLLGHDPFYNPNLSLKYTDYSLAFPPRASWRSRLM